MGFNMTALPALLRLVVVVTLPLLGISCGDNNWTDPSDLPLPPGRSAPAPAVPVTTVSLSIDGDRAIVGRGQTRQLRAIATRSDGTNEDRTGSATWRSADEQIATVSGAGIVTATGFGTVSIAATVDTLNAAITMTVSPVAIQFTVLSQGAPANRATCGGVVFQRDGTPFYSGRGCVVGSARGWNVAVIDRRTGKVVEVRNFDTWYYGAAAASGMIDLLNRQPEGSLLLLAVGDEGGMTVGRSSGCPSNPAPGSVCCRPLEGEFERLRQTLEALGSREIRNYCYWNSLAFLTIKGTGAQSEQIGKAAEARARYTLTLD